MHLATILSITNRWYSIKKKIKNAWHHTPPPTMRASTKFCANVVHAKCENQSGPTNHGFTGWSEKPVGSSAQPDPICKQQFKIKYI